ncbi:NUDIX domain-containing protein [Streptomyces tailanensis]|uniref:NUDIX domain-containing protein n=1 Tax=Streptomyces tailanensis TaxID=2569858 RepID=UPI001FE573FF|nr:NUDIX hydrolase [Streptomyces tailanensis]
MTTPAVPTTVMALLVRPDGRYLLHLRDANKHIPNAGQWSVPEGRPEHGESLHDAIARELREKAGLRLPGLAPLAVIENTDADDRPTSRVQVYIGTWSGDSALLPLTAGTTLRWTDPDQIPYLTVGPRSTVAIHHHEDGSHIRPCGDGQLPVLRVRSTGTKTVRNVIGAHLYLEDDGKILLGLRHPDSAYAPNEHHFLAGHCERESAIACLIREAREEAGLGIKAEDVELVHVVHVLDDPGAEPRMQFVFRARHWTGEPRVLERNKCVSWGWWQPDALPERTVAYTRAAIDGIRKGSHYTELGWT